MKNTRKLLEISALDAGLAKPSFTEWDFTSVSAVRACASVNEYFSASIPASTIDFGHLRVLSPADLSQENTELIPGCEISPHGFITIGATDTGDSIAVDLASGIAYLVSVDKFEDDMIAPGWKPDRSGFFENIPVTHTNIISVCEINWPDIHTAFTNAIQQEKC